ncbi:MAG: Crp/Fnr family transcriptional regulator [Gemmatimonadota bacterium]|nr:Crp/Fnr family transcriptional regulator [Gemmatimonadota bacterium]
MTIGNMLLDALPAADLAGVMRQLEPLPLPLGMVIYEPNARIDHVYFPTDGVVSMVSSMERGTVEVGTVGREGMVGLPILMHAKSMPTRAFVQVAGNGMRLSATQLRDEMRASPALERLLYRYAQALFDQVAQSAACNRLHTIEERCARWILMTHDRVAADTLALKQEFLAEMLGVHRPAVTLAAGALQRAGLITYSRGKITVVDREGLESASCPCYAIARSASERLRAMGAAAD